MKDKLKGVVLPAAVPLNEDHSVDNVGLRRLISFLIEAGVHGLFANGSMGAFALLTDRQQFQAIELIADLTQKRVPVLAGASETSTSRVLEKIKVIQEMAVDYIVVLAPYYYLLRQDELYHFFLRVADFAQKPIILYDNPRMSNNPIEVETIEKLARHENIRGIKISVPDAMKWQDLLRSNIPRERFSLFAGSERMMSLPLQLGFDGITGGLHNLIPAVVVDLYETVRRGDYEGGERLQQKINRVHKIFECDGGWRGLEVAFQYMGICEKVTAHPYDGVALPAEKRRQILEILEMENIARPYPSLLREEHALL